MSDDKDEALSEDYEARAIEAIEQFDDRGDGIDDLGRAQVFALLAVAAAIREVEIVLDDDDGEDEDLDEDE